eukprot:g3535.t1
MICLGPTQEMDIGYEVPRSSWMRLRAATGLLAVTLMSAASWAGASIGLVVCCLLAVTLMSAASWAGSSIRHHFASQSGNSGASGHSHTGYMPKDGDIESVLMRPGPPGLVALPPKFLTGDSPCLFAYGPVPPLKEGRVDEAVMYGVSVDTTDGWAILTGKPSDVLHGKLICFKDSSTFRTQLSVVDLEIGFDARTPHKGTLRRGEGSVVKRSGKVAHALFYYCEHLMRNQVWLLDYGAGNVRSLRNAVQSLGYDMNTVEKPEDIYNAEVLVFPGVGNFGEAMKVLHKRGYVEPLKWYIQKSGRPFMGICVGMQVLFASSEESDVPGLGVVPGAVTKFPTDKGAAVPQIGWNEYVATDHMLHRSVLWGGARKVATRDRVYFVHSYRTALTDETAPWALATTDYAGQRFVSAIQHGNVLATQFHPEKSGQVGVALLGAFLDAATSGKPLDSHLGQPVGKVTAKGLVEQSPPTHIARRVVACLDVRSNDQGDLIVTKGDSYDVREKHTGGTEGHGAADGDGYTNTGAVRNMGKPVELAARYFREGADEVTFLNICAFRSEPLGDLPLLSVLQAASQTIFVPLTIGGGIRSYTDSTGKKVSALDVAAAYFRAGADKVSLGSDAVHAAEAWYQDGGGKAWFSSGAGKPIKSKRPIAGEVGSANPSAIADISERYGAQAVVISVDPRRVWLPKEAHGKAEGPYGPYTVVSPHNARGPNGETECWYQCTVKGGREGRPIDAVQLARAVEALGAGEILLNCIDCDGKNQGFDLGLIQAVHGAVSIPVIASSGAGSAQHFVDVFGHTRAEAALAAGIFHRKEVSIAEVKETLAKHDIPSPNCQHLLFSYQDLWCDHVEHVMQKP